MISGKDVHEAARAHLERQGFEWLAWEDVVVPQGYYNDVAAKLNEQFIAPLLKLVKDYERFTSFDQPIHANSHDWWHAERDTLNKRAKILIGEEK